MSAARMCAARLLQRRWVGVLTLALLVGLGGGAVLAAAAGARRSASAASRLYRLGNVADVEIDPTQGTFTASQVDQIKRLPEVKFATTTEFFVAQEVRGGRPGPVSVFFAANPDGTWIYKFDKIGLLPSFEGRMPDPARADEVVATNYEARLRHLHIGSTLPIAVARFSSATAPPTYLRQLTMHVVGITTTPVGTLSGGDSSETFVFGTPAFARQNAAGSLGSTIYVLLRHKNDLAAFEQDAPAALKGVTFDFKPAGTELTTFARVARPFTAALWIFALVAALATILIVAQALVRMVRTDAGEAPQLHALGATATQRSVVAAARATLAVLIGTVVALVIAVLMSPLFPLGLVHRVEPHPGIRFDPAVLALGALGIIVVLGGIIGVAAWRAAHMSVTAPAFPRYGSSRTAAALARANAPLSLVQGTRLAFQRARSATTAATASSIFGLVAAVAAISAALVFGANLRELTTPSRYGQSWDAEITTTGTSPISPVSVQHLLTADRLASGITFGTFGDAHIGGQVISSYGMQPSIGATLPTAVKGRLPDRNDEVAIGAKMLRALHRSVGDSVTATTSTGQIQELHIVGETLLPALNPNQPQLGADQGAELTRAGLARLDPDLQHEVDFVLVRFAPHATLDQLRAHFPSSDYSVTGALPPSYIASYGDVQSTPLVLAGLLTVLGVGVLAHLLITSVRSNRRELAIIKTIGGRRRQVLGIVIVQALMLTTVALAVGFVVGIALGRGAWTRFVSGLNLTPSTAIPVAELIGVAVFALVSAALIALLPARAATRVAPARILRSE